MKDKHKEITLKIRGNRKFSDCYLQTVNPWAISAKLLKDNPDMPTRVAKAMTFSIISNEYTRLVIDEEHKEQQQNTELFFNVNEINGENK
jgi:hypothetical protein